ncbi:MAG: hypothetical protein K5776_09220 [Lachnospiraceae bacterium]|nr:hypothetical protein [Lachnospiraceae bacterium]
MKNRITGLISIILITIGLLVSAGFAIRNLVNLSGLVRPLTRLEGKLTKGDYVEGELYVESEEFYYIKHTLNGLIPVGTEHYYIAIDENTDTVYYLRSGKNTYKEVSPDSPIKIKGKVYKADSSVHHDFKEIKEYFEAEGLSVGYSGEIIFIDTEIGKRSLINILGVVLLIGGFLAVFLSPAGKKQINEINGFDKLLVFGGLLFIIVGGIMLITLPVFL